MGGRGSGSKRGSGADNPKSRFGNPVKTLKKVTKEKTAAPTLKTAKDIIPWVKSQVDVDLDKYRTKAAKRFENRRRIVIDLEAMPKTESRSLLLLEHQKYSNNIELKSLNPWLYEIRVKKRK